MDPTADLNQIFIKVRSRNMKKRCFVCSVHPEIFKVFLEVCGIYRTQIKKYLSEWTMEDFNWKMDFTARSHVDLLARLVDDKYRRIYPHIYYNHLIEEPQNWLRVWVSEHMGKEIRRRDRPAYNRLFNTASNYSSGF